MIFKSFVSKIDVIIKFITTLIILIAIFCAEKKINKNIRNKSYCITTRIIFLKQIYIRCKKVINEIIKFYQLVCLKNIFFVHANFFLSIVYKFHFVVRFLSRDLLEFIYNVNIIFSSTKNNL